VIQTAESLAHDFDRIARLPSDPWDHNRMYHRLLLRQLPRGARAALEIGCGAGEFSAALAQRVERVLALDLSAEMLAAAKLRCAGLRKVELVQADVLAQSLPREGFDVVASIATLHHLPLREIFARVSDTLRPGGVFLALDVSDERTLRGAARSAVAIPLNVFGRLLTTGSLRPSAEVRSAWAAHAATDRYPRVAEVRHLAAELLPGARVREHLFWRWSLIWRKP